NRDDSLKKIVNTTRGHQRVRDCRLLAHKIVTDDRLELRNYLAVSCTCIFAGAAEHGDLEQQLIGNEGVGKLHDSWPVVAEMLADQIEIAIETTVGASQTAIDTTVFECSESAPRELWHRKKFQHVSVTNFADLSDIFLRLL